MSAPGRAAAAALLLLAAGCGGPEAGSGRSSDVITADTVDPAMTRPGAIFRFGPATPEAIAGPVYPPVVVGETGEVSIYEGYFVQAPCSLPLQVDAGLTGDTVTVRVISEPDTARTDGCGEAERPLGYALLVGQFEPGEYAVRLAHEGDAARPVPLDTVYEGITVEPNTR